MRIFVRTRETWMLARKSILKKESKISKGRFQHIRTGEILANTYNAGSNSHWLFFPVKASTTPFGESCTSAKLGGGGVVRVVSTTIISVSESDSAQRVST